MNADNFRQLYAYHFHLNRKIWDECVSPLTPEQFTQELPYSVGSVRNQCVHLMNIDERWFTGLAGGEVPGFADPVHFGKREKVRQHWDAVEDQMRLYLDALTDEQVARSFEGDLRVWQVLFHVLAHGIDHRSQLLSMLNQLGVQTFPQDYALYLFGKI